MSLILLVSILIRLAAMGWSVVLWRRIVDWRMGFLTLMLLLMASRQTLTLIQTAESWVPDLGQKTELPGLVVSVMALLAVFFLERMLGEQRRAEVERGRLIGELESRMAELERFNYAVSHDLKSPLVTIKGFLPLLEKDLRAGDGETGAHDIERIRQAADQMGELLGQLQNLSRLSHTVDLSDRLPLGELAGECVALLAERIDRHGIEVRIAPDLPVVRCDRIRTLEVLQQLVENAIEYMGDQPRPRIEIGGRVEDGQVVCFVRDNGRGIERRYQEKIFGLFERLGRGGRGSGVGLALARRIVELHGGRIWVESEGERRGSTFYFTLSGAQRLVPPTA